MQPTLPIIGAWPALLGTETACLYLSLERRQFERLAERWRITSVDCGPACKRDPVSGVIGV